LTLLGSGCAGQTQYINTNPPVYFPPLPSNVKSAGDKVSIPKTVNNKKETKQLLLTLTKSERKNADAVNSCKSFYGNLQLIYNKKKSLPPTKKGVVS